MERSVSLRQQGYRLRAFKLVDTNEGKDYMDQIRRILASLSSAESSNFARFDSERKNVLSRMVRSTIVGNAALLLLAACLFGLMRYYARALAIDAARSRQELAARDLQLERLTSALCGQVRSNIGSINTISRMLLENYGGFLPRHGQECAEQIKEAAEQVERLRRELVGGQDSEIDERAA